MAQSSSCHGAKPQGLRENPSLWASPWHLICSAGGCPKPTHWDSRGAPQGGASFPVQPLAPSFVLLCSLPLLPLSPPPEKSPCSPFALPTTSPCPSWEPKAATAKRTRPGAQPPGFPPAVPLAPLPTWGPSNLPLPSPWTLDAPSPEAAVLILPLWLPGCRRGPAGPKAVALRVRPRPHIQLPGCCQVRAQGTPPAHTQAHVR